MKNFIQHFSSVIILCVFASASAVAMEKQQDVWVAAGDGGIYHGKLDSVKGEIQDFKALISDLRVTYMVKHPSLAVLYAVKQEGGTSTVASYKIDGASLTLQSALDKRPSGGAHINISADGKYVSVAYYNAGVVGVYAVSEDGSLVSTFDEELHQGSSINLNRQTEPHPHWSGFSPNGKFLYVTDLGTDHIWVYALGAKALELKHKVSSTPGAGPRHIAFHPSQDFAYVSDEMHLTVSIYKHEPATAELELVQVVKAMPEASKERSPSLSDIKVHPSGKFLYVVGRGYDRVAVFAIDETKGGISPVDMEPVRGTISRNIDFSAGGDWALVVGRVSNTLAVFKLDTATGELTYNHKSYAVPSPYSIVID